MDLIRFYKLLALSLSMESAALWLLNSHGDAKLMLFWLLHACASAAASWLVWWTLPPSLRHPRILSLLLVFLLALLFPLIGMVGLLLASRLALAMPKSTRDEDAVQQAPQLDIYAIDPQLDKAIDALPPGQIARIASDATAPTPQRIRAVLALRDMPARLALPLLRSLLGDPDEEIRLLAYGIASQWEQRLTADLQQAQKELDALRSQGSSGNTLARAAQRVAELQMEFIYQGLAQGDLRKFALDQAWHYTIMGLQAQPDHPALLMLRLRLSMAKDDLDNAQNTLLLLDEQTSPSVWVPYAAELAWKHRNFTAVGVILGQLRNTQVAPRLRPILRLWSPPDQQA
ncbi:MAG: HEAT repeat domain-containing protein [Thiomonas delicata]